MRVLAFAIALALTLRAQDAGALLAKAHQAFEENSQRERYWVWTSTTSRSMLDKSGKLLETIPSITVESPIRVDGRRCSAVLAWGDGVEPYLANADAEERCKVQEEVPSTFKLEAVLQYARGTVKSQAAGEIAVTIHASKQASQIEDAVQRCAATVEGSIVLDSRTYFPKLVDLRIPGEGCKLQRTEVQDHYNGSTVQASGGLVKGSHMLIEYQLQKDKSGNRTRDFWVAAHQRRELPIAKNVQALVISGRVIQLASKGRERITVMDIVTRATEASAESVVTFEIPK